MSAMQQCVRSGRCVERRARHTPASRRGARHIACSAAVRAVTGPTVKIDVDKTSWNSRRIIASVSVATPKGFVWSALTDYDNLGKIVPSLVENRCLERRGNTCVLYQVGAQDVAMGVKFSAACTLRCAEHPDGGAPAALLTCSTNPDDLEVRFPAPPPPAAAAAAAARTPGAASPSSSPSSSPEGSGWSADGSPASSGNGNGAGAGAGGPLASTSDITFELLEGDFQSFRGVWRMQQLDPSSTLLSYALYVKPQSWLPVGLIQGRIENEVVRNLEAVCRYAESQYLTTQRQR